MIIEQWLLALPQALVYVHTGAIVAKDGFGHECHGLPMLAGCILHDIFVEHHIICGLQQRIKTDIDLRLPWTANFMMLRLDQHAQFFEEERHLTANVLERIVGGDREVALFYAHAVAQVGRAVTPAIPVSLVRIYLGILGVFTGFVAHVIEDEKFGFRAKVAGVSDSAGAQISLCLVCNIAWIAAIALLASSRARMGYVTDQAQRRDSSERVHHSGSGIGDNQHIAFVDGLEATYTGAVKGFPFDKGFFFEFAHRHTKMLPCARQIYKFEVHHFCAMLCGKLQYIFRHHVLCSPYTLPHDYSGILYNRPDISQQ